MIFGLDFAPATLPKLVIIWTDAVCSQAQLLHSPLLNPGFGIRPQKYWIWSIKHRYWQHSLLQEIVEWEVLTHMFSSLCERQWICALADQSQHNLEQRAREKEGTEISSLLLLAQPRVTHTHTVDKTALSNWMLCRVGAWGQNISAVNKTHHRLHHTGTSVTFCLSLSLVLSPFLPTSVPPCAGRLGSKLGQGSRRKPDLPVNSSTAATSQESVIH